MTSMLRNIPWCRSCRGPDRGARAVGLRQQTGHRLAGFGWRPPRRAASRTLSSTSAIGCSSNPTQTELTAQSRGTLDKQAQWLQQYGNYTFTIEGHADERGTREYNIALGARRAQSVRDYLASRGIQPGRMRTVSYGKERPVAVCNDISCWSQNRRAVTVLGATS